MRNESDRDIACKEFLLMGMRATIKESFEIIKSYGEKPNQDSILKSKNWYPFYRMIRNCLSHNFKFEFNDYDKIKLPVSWKGKIIDISMDRTYLSLSLFGYVEAWELFLEFNDFVLNELN